MGEAFFWGLVAGSSLVLGGLVALVMPIHRRVLGLIMGFGSGVLISAVAYDLVGEAADTSAGSGGVALGLFSGAAVFFFGDALVDRLGGADRKSPEGEQGGGSPFAIVLGIVLDGIPESAVIGLTLLEGHGVGVAVLVAVFISNLPEAIAATTGLAITGWSGRKITGLWVAVALVSALAALAGYGFFGDASSSTLAFVLSFAGGAILTMLADAMMPDAFLYGGKLVGIVTTFGFAVAFAISALE